MSGMTPETGEAPELEMRGIGKTFGAIRALTDVSCTFYRGEVHALMGENGAGKSTLMKILSGAYQADPGGEIRLKGKPVTIDGPLTGSLSLAACRTSTGPVHIVASSSAANITGAYTFTVALTGTSGAQLRSMSGSVGAGELPVTNMGGVFIRSRR